MSPVDDGPRCDDLTGLTELPGIAMEVKQRRLCPMEEESVDFRHGYKTKPCISFTRSADCTLECQDILLRCRLHEGTLLSFLGFTDRRSPNKRDFLPWG